VGVLLALFAVNAEMEKQQLRPWVKEADISVYFETWTVYVHVNKLVLRFRRSEMRSCETQYEGDCSQNSPAMAVIHRSSTEEVIDEEMKEPPKISVTIETAIGMQIRKLDGLYSKLQQSTSKHSSSDLLIIDILSFQGNILYELYMQSFVTACLHGDFDRLITFLNSSELLEMIKVKFEQSGHVWNYTRHTAYLRSQKLGCTRFHDNIYLKFELPIIITVGKVFEMNQKYI
jgi:hypothetical protein